MRVATRHRPLDPERFAAAVHEALTVLSGMPGFVDGELGRSPDDATAWLFATRWADVGSMRRGLGSASAKIALAPVMVSAGDEPSVFEVLLHATPAGVEAGSSALAEPTGTPASAQPEAPGPAAGWPLAGPGADIRSGPAHHGGAERSDHGADEAV